MGNLPTCAGMESIRTSQSCDGICRPIEDRAANTVKVDMSLLTAGTTRPSPCSLALAVEPRRVQGAPCRADDCGLDMARLAATGAGEAPAAAAVAEPHPFLDIVEAMSKSNGQECFDGALEDDRRTSRGSSSIDSTSGDPRMRCGSSSCMDSMSLTASVDLLISPDAASTSSTVPSPEAPSPEGLPHPQLGREDGTAVGDTRLTKARQLFASMLNQGGRAGSCAEDTEEPGSSVLPRRRCTSAEPAAGSSLAEACSEQPAAGEHAATPAAAAPKLRPLNGRMPRFPPSRKRTEAELLGQHMAGSPEGRVIG